MFFGFRCNFMHYIDKISKADRNQDPTKNFSDKFIIHSLSSFIKQRIFSSIFNMLSAKNNIKKTPSVTGIRKISLKLNIKPIVPVIKTIRIVVKFDLLAINESNSFLIESFKLYFPLTYNPEA